MTDWKRDWVVLVLAAVWGAGCQESGSRVDRRAQLVGQENLQLKKQIQDKDREIERLKQEIQSLQEKAQKDEDLHGQTYTKMMDIIADITAQLEACKAGKPMPEESGANP